MVLIVPLALIILVFIVIYASRRLWWIGSIILLLVLMWLVIPSSQDWANTIAVKTLISLIIVPSLILTRYFSRLYRRKGMGILRDYWRRK
jgi:hypothetical protein